MTGRRQSSFQKSPVSSSRPQKPGAGTALTLHHQEGSADSENQAPSRAARLRGHHGAGSGFGMVAKCNVSLLIPSTGMQNVVNSLSMPLLVLLELLDQLWHNLMQIADNTVVSNSEDRGVLVAVDGDNDFRIHYAYDMLDLS